MAANRFDSLIAHWEARLQRAFLDAIQEIRNEAQIDQIERMLLKGDIDGAVRAVGLDPVQFRGLDKTFEAAYEAGGIATVKSIPPAHDVQGFRVKFQFNIRNPLAENFLRNHSSNLIRDILDDQRNMIRSALTEGMKQGLNPRTVALDLIGKRNAAGNLQGGLIGLTDSQRQWVINYANELINDPAASLSRVMRDRRFDWAIKEYVKAGKEIPIPLMSKMVTAYRNRALRLRAETIARKEAITALHSAQQQAMDTAVASGALKPETVTYVWRTAHDNRVRDTHRSMDGQVRKYGHSFVTGSGAHLDYPGDPSGPAAEVINCRCWREPKVDFLAGIK